MREQIADLALFESHVQALISTLKKVDRPASSNDGWTSTFDLQPYLERFTMDTATEFLFGESVQSQIADDGSTTSSNPTSTLFSKKEMRHFVNSFFAAEKTTAKSMFYGDLFWLAHDRAFKSQCKAVHDFVDTYVHRRLNSEKRTDNNKYVVLDAIIADVSDPKELRSQLLNILLAGSDTISATLGFALASLAQYPDIFRKLRRTVLEEFGSYEQPREITLAKLKNCSYLQWFLSEVLRMYPAVPVNFREAVRDTTLPVGGGPDGTEPVFVPKGYFIAWEVRCSSLSSKCFPIPPEN